MNQSRRKVMSRVVPVLMLFSLMLQGVAFNTPVTPANASVQAIKAAANANTPNPTSVTIAGSLEHLMGCGGDWDAGCAAAHLTYDPNDDVWQGTWTLPAGDYEYKAALNDGWDENYGLHAQPGGANIPLHLAASTAVKFYYDHKTHWITDNVNSVIAVAPGSFQHTLGCSGDWQADCLRSWLQDIDGDGIYTLETTGIPVGTYEAKVALNESWDINYGQGGQQNGPNIPFTVDAPGQRVRFTYDSTSHVLTIQAGHGHDNNVEYNGLGHNSQDTIYRQPQGATNPGTMLTLRFRTFHNDVTGVRVRFYDYATSSQFFQDMQLTGNNLSCYDANLANDTCDYYQTTYTPTVKTTLYYRFIVTDGTATAYYADDFMKDGGWGTATADQIDLSYPVTVFDPAFQPIPWMKNAVIYQIFPDRFRNGRSNNDPSGTEPRYSYPPTTTDQIIHAPWGTLPEGYCTHYVNPAQPCTQTPKGRDYFGGDLKGVDQELGYLASVGVNTLYFNPIFDSGSDHGYDTQNYFQIDPFFGTQKDWDNLEKHAQQLGMRIVLDGVFNHVSSDSKYFDRYHHYSDVGACESVNSPYRSWFTFTPQANGPCAGPNGPNTMNYNAWFGFDSLPVLDKTNPAVQQLVYAGGPNSSSSVAPYWLKQGADGWRLDVMGDGSFPASFWQQFRTVVKGTKSDAPIIGELWKRDEVLPKVLGDQADTTMNYRFRNAVMGLLGTVDNKGFPDDLASLEAPSIFANKMNSIREDYPDATYYNLMNLMDSHDTQRILWSLTPGQDNREGKEFNVANLALGKQNLKLASVIQFTVPGAPTIYYGDEVGMTGSDDPDDRRTFPWVGDAPGGDPNILAQYQKMTTIRSHNPVFRNGALKFLLTDDANRTMAYGMRTTNPAQVAIVALNVTTNTVKTLNIPLAGYLRNGVTFSDVLNVGQHATSSNGTLQVALPALGAAVFVADSGQDLTPPPAPTGVHADGSNHTATVQWTAVPGAASYNVYRTQLSGGGYQLAGSANGTTFNDTNLDNARTYYYAVTALDSAGNESVYSAEASVVPFAPIGWAGHLWPPSLTITINANQHQTVYAQVYIAGVTDSGGQGQGVLAQFAYGPVSSDPATWTWSPMVYNTDVGNNDEYKIDFTPEQVGSFQYLARFSTNLGHDWTYAYADDGSRGALTVNSSGDTTAPAAPANLHVVLPSATFIEIGWDANSEPDLYRYEVYRGTASGGPYTKIANVPAGTTQYTDNSVATNNTYYYVVKATDTSFNVSLPSNEISAVAAPRTVHVVFTATVPATTDGTGRTVHIAGSFPSPYPQWDPGSLPMTRVDATHWTITLDMVESTQVDYKYVLGDWNYVEKGAACDEITNRPLTVTYVSGGTQNVNDTVANWRNVSPCGN